MSPWLLSTPLPAARSSKSRHSARGQQRLQSKRHVECHPIRRAIVRCRCMPSGVVADRAPHFAERATADRRSSAPCRYPLFIMIAIKPVMPTSSFRCRIHAAPVQRAPPLHAAEEESAAQDSAKQRTGDDTLSGVPTVKNSDEHEEGRAQSGRQSCDHRAARRQKKPIENALPARFTTKEQTTRRHSWADGR